MNYIVIEIQVNASGTVGNLVTAFDSREQAESKFHAVLSAAAISTLPVHSCALLDSTLKLLDRGCYTHASQEENNAG